MDNKCIGTLNPHSLQIYQPKWDRYSPDTSLRPHRLIIESDLLTIGSLRKERVSTVGHDRTTEDEGIWDYYSALLTPENLLLISTVSTAFLMLTKGAVIHKSFLVPLFALEVPSTIVAWMKGEYGIWTAFLALLVRLFFFIPEELELPFLTFLLVIVSPYQITGLRGTKEGVILSLVISGLSCFPTLHKTSGYGKAFDQGSIVATIAIIGIVSLLFLLLI